MNRKGDVGGTYMVLLNIFFLAAVLFTFAKLHSEFAQEHPDEALGTRQTALLQSYATAEEMLLYLDTAATFAAYEAADAVLRRGAMNLVSNPCGTYAGYQRWTSRERTCIPGRDEIHREFARETLRVLRGMLQHPAMPPLAEYDTAVSAGEEIALAASTEDRIVLPIVTAKGNFQTRAAAAVREESASQLLTGKFDPDSHLTDEVVVTQNRRERSDPDVGQIVILDTMQDAADAIHAYEEGTGSVHYLVLADGRTVQLVPEALAAIFCKDCPRAERIGVALEHAGDEEQMSALVELVADLQRRHDADVKLLGELTGEDNPEAFDKASFLRQVGVAKSRQEQGLGNDETEDAGSGIAASWVADDYTITSCFGKRDLGDGHHDGIDVDDTTSDNVYAFAAGIVTDTCETSGGGTLNGCSRYCNGFGTTAVIAHPDGRKSRYSHMGSLAVRKGDEVEAGQLIGRIGNTGCSTGSHLDFKIFEPDGSEGRNPLCYYDDNVLRNMDLVGASCRKYGTDVLRHSNPVLRKECEDIDPMRRHMGCFGAFTAIGVSGEEKVQVTIERLREQGLLDPLREESGRQGIDPNLVIALVAQETCITRDGRLLCGRPDLISPTGCAGLGQFCTGTANLPAFREIFGSGVQRWSCPLGGPCTAAEAGCTGRPEACDPRFDAGKSIRAIPLHLRLDRDAFFRGMSAEEQFMVAAYNAGGPAIERAIGLTGSSDPSWEEVAAVLDRVLEPAKAKEVRDYVRHVTRFYLSLGGSLSGAFSDTYCPDQQLDVKELGRYEFVPNFRVEMPNVLQPVERLTAWADSVYGTCRGERDNRQCLLEEIGRFNSRQDDVEVLPSCQPVEGENIVTTRYRRFLEDCRENGQSDCYCAFNVNRKDAQLRLYGETVHTFVEGREVNDLPLGNPSGLFADSPDEEPEEVTLSLDALDGDLEYRMWAPTEEGSEADHFGELVRAVETEEFKLYKGNRTHWIADPGDTQACGVYKTQHHVCARLKQKTYRDGEAVEPVVKMAMYLEDVHDPLPVTDLSAVSVEEGILDAVAPGLGDVIGAVRGMPVRVTFEPSESDDVSYYLAACETLGIRADEQHIPGREYDGLGRDVRIGTTINATVPCGSVTDDTRVIVRPVDISGNVGEAAGAAVTDEQLLGPVS